MRLLGFHYCGIANCKLMCLQRLQRLRLLPLLRCLMFCGIVCGNVSWGALQATLLPYKFLSEAGFTVHFTEQSGRLQFTYAAGNKAAEAAALSGELVRGFPFFRVGEHHYALPSAPFNGKAGFALSDEAGAFFSDVIGFYLKRFAKQAVVTLIKAKPGPPAQSDNRSQSLRQPPLTPVFAPRSADAARIHTVILDPGHGGRDPGAQGFGYREKTMVLSFTKQLARMLKERNPKLKVILTRKTDRTLSIQERSAIANRLLSGERNAIFVSLHLNAWFHGRARGYEVYHLSSDSDVFTVKSQHQLEHETFFFPYQQEDVRQAFALLYTIQYARESELLAELMLRHLQRALPRYARLSSARRETFYVLKGTLMPSILIELGYITNEDDLRLLLSDTRRKQLLITIAGALEKYIDIFVRTRGFTKEVFQLEAF